MNIYLLTHDIWFYTTLLLLSVYIILGLLSYRFLKPFMSILRVSGLGKKKIPTSHPVKEFYNLSHSSLRDKLHGAKN